jgi:hypothetical protein
MVQGLCIAADKEIPAFVELKQFITGYQTGLYVSVS